MHRFIGGMLAAGSDLFDLLIPILFIVIAVVSSLGKAAKKAGSPPRDKRRSPGPANRGGAAPKSLEELAELRRRRMAELAARRKRQLEELARRRQAGRASRGRGGETAPVGRSSPSVSPHRAPPVEQSVQQHLAEQARRRRARAEAEARRRQTIAERRARALAERERRAEEQRRRAMAERMAVHEEQHGDQVAQVHRHVPDASRPVVPAERGASYWRQHMQLNRRQALRMAVVMKEILDRPVGLREPGWVPGPDW